MDHHTHKPTYRVFTGLAIPNEVATLLHPLQQGLPHVTWTKGYNFHITLNFLGRLEGPTLQHCIEVLHEIAAKTFSIRLEGTGYFKSRALWVGVEPTDPLHDLKAKIDSLLLPLGIELDPKPFRPHLTIARLRKTIPEEKLAEYLEQTKDFCYSSIPYNEFILFESRSTDHGTHYQPLATYPLLP